MQQLIEYSLKIPRTILLLFSFFMIAGGITYFSIPKESAPDIKIPIIYTLVQYYGIAPKDAEKLIIRPLEEELRTIEGVKDMQSSAFEGGGQVTLKFQAGYDLNRALADVRYKVNTAKTKLPADAKEPEIKEVNISLFPALVVHLSGNVPERTLLHVGQNLQDNIEANKSVLEAPVVGGRKEVLHLFVDPLKLESYGISFSDLMNTFKVNHVIVASGNVKTGSGKFPIKTPGLIKSVEEIEEMPIKMAPQGEVVVRFKDVGQVVSSYEDRTSYARIQGMPSLSLDVSKRTGENIIKTIQEVRESTEKFIKGVCDSIKITFAQDTSERIYEMLTDLQNNVILAIILVMLVVVRSLGWRSSLLVGISIPTSFLMGIFIISLLGYTLNMVVLFSLILAVGMLVDGAIIVVEYADRKMLEGFSPLDAYRMAAIRMRWPVISSILTILLVFLPLLFWPGVIGQFMKYLPITLLATLISSLFVALLFVPTLGSIFGRPNTRNIHEHTMVTASESGDLTLLKGGTGFYVRWVGEFLKHPERILWGVLALLIIVVGLYGKFGRGVEFFPDVEPDSAAYVVRARGNLSLEEKDRLVRLVEEDLLKEPYFKTISTQTKEKNGTDAIGNIIVELADWRHRPKAQVVFDKTLEKVRRHPGIMVEVNKNKKGPSVGKSIQVLVSAENYEDLSPEIQRVRTFLETVVGLEDIEDSRPLAGLFEWEIKIDRVEAARFGLSIHQVGKALESLTDGSTVGSYRPSESRDEVDMKVRFTQKNRTLTQLDQIRIDGPKGAIPLSYVASWAPTLKIDTIDRTNGKVSMTLAANVNTRYLTDDKVKEIQSWLDKNPPKSSLTIEFKGEEEDKQETKDFLVKAFLVAIFLIVIVLVTQFNSFFSTMLVISAVFLSVIGVLIGLLVMNQTFSIVMSGIGVIALGGIMVSNNIIFIDTFDELREKFTDVREAILRTAAQRLRPIILTHVTVILGLLPILFQVTIDFFGREITVGAPACAWWVQLANAIVFGVLIASILTLIVTPCALMAREQWRIKSLKK